MRSPVDAPTQAKASEDCLLVVWGDAPPADETFDRANDAVAGGAISCATGTSPTRFEETLRELRAAARSGDRAALVRELEIPMIYIDGEGRRRSLTSPRMVDAASREVFTEDVLEVIRRLDLSEMTVVPGEGAFFELGSVWLVVPEPGARPRLLTINRQAMLEAAAAARETLPVP